MGSIRYLRSLFASTALAALGLLQVGCFSVKSYVDPGPPVINAADLRPAATPQPVVLNLDFQTNGKTNKRATKEVRPIVVRALKQSKQFSKVSSPAARGSPASNGVARLDVVINNVANTGEAVGKGFGTGATYGLVGTQVTDHYAMRATYYPASGTESTNKTYRHALHSTIGNKKGPPGLTPMKLKDGTRRVFEQMTLTCLRDLQAEGKL